MLNSREIDEFRERIEAELTTIHAALAGNADGGVVELDQTSVGRLSRMDAMQQQALKFGLRERLSLKKDGWTQRWPVLTQAGSACVTNAAVPWR